MFIADPAKGPEPLATEMIVPPFTLDRLDNNGSDVGSALFNDL